MATLTDQEKKILDLAGEWYRFPGARAEDIRHTFDMSETTFWRKVNDLLANPAALAYAPSTVKRLLRLQEQRLAARSMRGLRAG